MKKKLLVLGLLMVFSVLFLNAQEIKIHRFQGGYKYTQEQKVLKLKNLANAVANNDEAYNLALQAKSFSDLGFIVAFVGGGFIGAPIGKAMAGGDPKWLSAGIGGGLLLSGLQFYKISSDKAKAAIEIHNGNLSFSLPNKKNYHFVSNFSSVGFIIRF